MTASNSETVSRSLLEQAWVSRDARAMDGDCANRADEEMHSKNATRRMFMAIPPN